MTYFDEVVARLNIDDVSLLTLLQECGANRLVKGKTKEDLKKESFKVETQFSEAAIRSALSKLEALLLIERDSTSKHHKFIITSYGFKALEYHLEGEMI
ncbi:hypothetical protein MH122_13780 [Bacillus pumilus]|uniref:hypothetical protein n=1 Tax=Bacillus pumilus TaxID=1408 RepID=UPI002280BCF6|nr:hypothetical protein [Bacillus pumilus]MCY7679868.1 hypothetical protein [Bacillus pumilus]